MRKMCKNLVYWSFLLVALIVGSCKSDKVVDNEDLNQVEIKLSDIEATFNNVTFSASAKDAIALSYLCVANQQELSASDVFKQGKTSGTSEGRFTVSDLESETEYTLYVAARMETGFAGPTKVSFTTLENSGEPESPGHAGIRISELSESNFIWEVANGDEIDFSLSYITPTIAAENDIFEASKSGISEEEWVTSIITTYGYLTKPAFGAGKVTVLNYNECFPEDYVIPDADYSIYTLGCVGEYNTDDVSTWELKGVTRLDVRTKAFELQGNPEVDVKLSRKGYIFVEHELVPNADASYFATFFTKTSEIEEYRKMYDEKEGPGAGDVRLRDFVRMYNTYALGDNTQPEKRRIDVPYGDSETFYTRLALGFDRNYMAGEKLGESSDNTKELDPSVAAPVYTMETTDIGATNLTVRTNMSGNCARVYWRVDLAGAHDRYFESQESLNTLTWDLYNGGWVSFRENGTNANQDEEYQQDAFHYAVIPGREYEIVSVGLNYDGGFSTPVISGKFTSKEMSLGDYESPLELTFPSVNKVSVVANYFIPDDKMATADDQRMMYHRIFEVGDEVYEPIFEKGEDYLQEWMCQYSPAGYGECDFYNSNVWSIRNNDAQLGEKYNHRWTWAAMNPGTKYRYVYVTEDKEGVVSKVKIKEFTTANNDGGLNPSLSVEVDEESFLIDAMDEGKYGFSTRFVPNEDMTSFVYLYLSEYAIDSWGYDVNNEQDLQQGIYELLIAQGLQSVESSFIGNTPGVYEIGRDDVVYAAGFGYGASGIKSQLTYVKITTENGKLKSIEPMVKVDLPEDSNAAAAYGIKVPYAPQSIKSVSVKANSIKVPKLEIDKPLYHVGANSQTVADDNEEVASEDVVVEEPVSIKEFSRKVVTRQF